MNVPKLASILNSSDKLRADFIAKSIPGYSGLGHYAFFRWLLESNRSIAAGLILGVYHGRDMAMIVDAARGLNRSLDLVGVDRFEDAPCADWDPNKRGLNWQQAGFGEPPNYASAARNVGQDGRGVRIVIEKSDDEAFLKATGRKFDWVHFDTSHDEATVTRQLRQVPAVCNPGAILTGDDYENRPFWGVIPAVTKAFREHWVFNPERPIWISTLENLRK